MYSVNKRKESQYALCQKYEELYFDSLDIKIKDIPPQIRVFSSCIYLEAFKRIKTIHEFNQLLSCWKTIFYLFLMHVLYDVYF